MATITSYYGLNENRDITDVNAAIANAPWRMTPCESGANFLRVFLLTDEDDRPRLRFDIVIRESRLLLSVTPLRWTKQAIVNQVHGELEALLTASVVINANCA
jgi:hypothetical protein